MTSTEKMLIEIYGSPVLDTEDLGRVFHLGDSKDPKSGAKVVRDLIAKGSFYVPTYKLTDAKQSRRVADVSVVAAYLDSRRQHAA